MENCQAVKPLMASGRRQLGRSSSQLAGSISQRITNKVSPTCGYINTLTAYSRFTEQITLRRTGHSRGDEPEERGERKPMRSIVYASVTCNHNSLPEAGRSCCRRHHAGLCPEHARFIVVRTRRKVAWPSFFDQVSTPFVYDCPFATH